MNTPQRNLSSLSQKLPAQARVEQVLVHFSVNKEVKAALFLLLIISLLLAAVTVSDVRYGWILSLNLGEKLLGV